MLPTHFVFCMIFTINNNYSLTQRALMEAECSLCGRNCVFIDIVEYFQAVSRRPFTVQVRVRVQASPCADCGGKRGTETGFIRILRVFSVSFFNQCSTLILLITHHSTCCFYQKEKGWNLLTFAVLLRKSGNVGPKGTVHLAGYFHLVNVETAFRFQVSSACLSCSLPVLNPIKIVLLY